MFKNKVIYCFYSQIFQIYRILMRYKSSMSLFQVNLYLLFMYTSGIEVLMIKLVEMCFNLIMYFIMEYIKVNIIFMYYVNEYLRVILKIYIFLNVLLYIIIVYIL